MDSTPESKDETFEEKSGNPLVNGISSRGVWVNRRLLTRSVLLEGRVSIRRFYQCDSRGSVGFFMRAQFLKP